MRGNNRNRENTVESRNDFERLREIIFITVRRMPYFCGVTPTS